MDDRVYFDYSALEGRIKQYYDTQEKFAKEIPMSRTSLNQRLQNKINFTTQNVLRICELLHIPRKEINNYFFCISSSENRI